MSKLPTVFVSHGSPMLALEPGSAAPMLERLGSELPRPRAILAFSPHWMTPGTTMVGMSPFPETIHDFGGFDRRLYDLQYPAPGDPDLAQRVLSLASAAGWLAKRDPSRGLDHGIWMPLRLMFSQAEIPVVPLAMPWPLDAAGAYRLGQAFSILSHEGVLLLGTGSLTHNLHEFDFATPLDAPAEPYVTAFTQWMRDALTHRDTKALLDYRQHAPHATRAHPTDEHLLPLFWALGAAGPEAKATWMSGGVHYASMAMDACMFLSTEKRPSLQAEISHA